MAKSRALNGVTLTYPATTAYKQWVRAQLRARGWTQQRLVDEMKRADRSLATISTATISDFLGPEDRVPAPSNSKLLPAINKVFGIAPPPVCDPSEELSQLVDKFRARWAKMTPRDRRMLLELLEKQNAGSGDPETSQADGTTETQTRRTVSGYREGVKAVTTGKIPHLQQGGTVTADRALESIGDDPHTLALAIQLMDRMLARRSRKSAKRRLTR